MNRPALNTISLWIARVFKVIGYAIAIGTLVLLLMGAHWAWRMFGTTHPDLNRITELTGIEFPSKTRLVKSELQGEFMCLLYLKVEMSKKDTEKFMAALPKSSSRISRTEMHRTVESEDLAWYNCSPKKFISVIVTPNGHFSSDILIDLDHKDRAVLYLYHTR